MAKISGDVIKPFNGEGDVVAWLQKVELVASLSEVKSLAKFIPLYLEDGAMAVYLEMEDEDKQSAEKIKKRLKDAFTEGMFVAFGRLKRIKWSGEAVDVFANEIRRLAKEAGFEGKALEHVVRLTFITGFPDDVGLELQQVEEITTMAVGKIVARARILTSNRGARSSTGEVVAPALKKPERKRLECYKCGGPHLMRECEKVRCFICNETGHISTSCPQKRKPQKSGWCATNWIDTTRAGSVNRKMPIIQASVGGVRTNALVDTGCTTSVVRCDLAGRVMRGEEVLAFDGRRVQTGGRSMVGIRVGSKSVELEATVMEDMVDGIGLIIGMDLIERLGGVTVRERQVRFGGDNIVAAGLRDEPRRSEKYCFIEDRDFDAEFDGEVWTVRYRMKEGQEPVLKNKVSEYEKGMTPENQSRYEKEIEKWISEEILVPWRGEEGGVLPIMPVEQENKGKVRPVLDFRELNSYVECHTGDETIDVCGEIIREWRRMEGGNELIDLKSAYLQIKIAEELWQYQLVKYKGKVYCLTRMGFGLNSAPRIMSKILKTVLGKSDRIRNNTSSYIDDILVDTKRISTEEVVNHLKSFGLEAKAPEKLEQGRALGMKLELGNDGELQFKRGNEIPECGEELTRRELFSACGKLVGHYPVCNWLRLATSYVKRISEGVRWDDKIGENAMKVYGDIIERTKRSDPVRGCWHVQKTESGRVWCDASNLGIGVVVEINGKIVEDAAWMRKREDHNHINVAELEAVLRGMNLGIKWGLKNIEIVTDSVTVKNWVTLTLTGERRVRTKGAAEMLIKRRLGTMKSLIDELGLNVEVSYVESGKNKADALTRVGSQRKQFENEEKEEATCALTVRQGHESHHMGVERTWYQAKKVDPKVTKEEVKRVVRSCEECQSIDPAPVRHEMGNLSVNDNWKRIAVDVTHYRCIPYLSLVDCGPGRFAVWKELKRESAEEVCERLEELFLERGPVNEVLMDNGSAFRSERMRVLLERWKVTGLYRTAYRPEGNGIVERHHRTIKVMAERGNMSPREAVFWYNSSPRYGQQEETVPSKSIFTYDWRHPEVKEEESEETRTDGRLSVGDEVWVKPPKGTCTTRWKRGTVTKVRSSNNLEIDGTPRHTLDLRRVIEHAGEEMEQDEEEENVNSDRGGPNRSERVRQRPRWLDDYEC